MTNATQVFDPVAAFPDFYGNDAVRALAPHRLWTVSDNQKRPVDIGTALNGPYPQGCPRCGTPGCSIAHGAQLASAKDQLLTLDELTERLPTASNAAVHFDWQLSRTAVLDIEPHCPPAVADQLLRLVTGSSAEGPTALYHELSRSGQGYHLLMPLPSSFASSGSDQRAVIRHPLGWYEVLLYHWITFSRTPIAPERLAQAQASPHGDAVTWDGVFSQLVACAPARRPGSGGRDILDETARAAADETLSPVEDSVLAAVLGDHRRNWTRSLRTDFGGDTSRWEYAQLTRMAATAKVMLENIALAEMTGPLGQELGRRHQRFEPEYRIEPLVRIVYAAALRVLPPRNKHSTFRSGLPYLLKQASNASGDVL